MKRKKKVFECWVDKEESLPLFWKFDGEGPASELDIGLIWKDQWHEDMKKIRIIVEELSK